MTGPVALPIVIAAGLLASSFPVEAGQGTPASGQDVTVRSGSRLDWDQATSGEAPSYGFTLHVYGVPMPLADVRCQRGASSRQYSCSAAFPELPAGRHVVQISAADGNHESGRSNSLIVTVGQPAPPRTEITWGRAAASTGAVTRPFCIGTDRCYRVEAAATVQRPITHPVVLDDGRTFVLEDGVGVRVMADGRMLPEPALTRDRATDRIVALAVDAEFAKNRFVYVAWIEEAIPAARMLVIARYREVHNTLGERSVVVPGVPLPADGDPVMAMDDRNRIYVAVPAAGNRPGSLLRFASDGTTPWQSGQTSPMLDEIYPRPTAVASDSVGRRMWLAGLDAAGTPVLDSVAWDTKPVTGSALDAPSPVTGWPVSLGALRAPGHGLAVVKGDGADAGSRSLLLLDGMGRLHRVSLADRAAAGAPVRLAFDHGALMSLASNGRRLAAVVDQSTPDGSPRFTLLSLIPE